MTGQPQTLVPFDKREALSLKEAAGIADRSEGTIRSWCGLHDIGRRVAGGSWRVSRVALAMFLDGDAAALQAYHEGDRVGDRVKPYFERAGLC